MIELGGLTGVGNNTILAVAPSQCYGEIIEINDDLDGAADAVQGHRGSGKRWYQCLENHFECSLEGTQMQGW